MIELSVGKSQMSNAFIFDVINSYETKVEVQL